MEEDKKILSVEELRKERDFSLVKSEVEKKVQELSSVGIVLSPEETKKVYDFFRNKLETDLNRVSVLEEIKNLNPEKIRKLINKEKEKQEPPKNKISLENITDFTDEIGKSYISIHLPEVTYPENRIRVFENHTGKTAKEIFEEHKDDDGLVAVNGLVDFMDVSKQNIEKEKIETPMQNITELAKRGEFSKLSKEAQQNVIGTLTAIINSLANLNENQRQKLRNTPVDELMKILDKEVYLSPEDNIVIICEVDDPEKDQIMSVKKDSKGYFSLVGLNANGYNYVNESNENSNIEGSFDSEMEETNDLEMNEEEEKKKDELGGTPYIKKPNPRNKRNAA